MPFYYATSRKENQRSQGGGPSSYVRSAPSSLFYVTISAIIPWILTIAYTFFGSSVLLLSSPRNVDRILENTWGFVSASMIEVFPVRLPGIAIRFRGAPRAHYIDRLQMMGASVSKLPGSRVDTWLLEKTSKDMLGEILTFDGMETFRPPAGFICSAHIESVALLVTRLYIASRTLFQLSTLSTKDELLIRYKAKTAEISEKADESDSEEEEEEEGEVMKDRTVKGERSVVNVGSDSQPSLVVPKERASEYEFVPVYTRDASLPSHGIVVPFERNYAAPDPNALNVFFSEFQECFFEDDDHRDEAMPVLFRAWLDSVMDSTFGLWLSHIMTTLVIAKRLGTHAQFFRRVDGTYEGGVIATRAGLRVMGGDVVYGKGGTELLEEMGVFGAHFVALRNIGLLVGANAAEMERLTSIRNMRGLKVVLDLASPGALTQNAIQKELPKLAFDETPTPVNTQTLVETIQYLANPDLPIPESWFLPGECLFSSSRVECTLARFGKTVPSFSFGGPVRIRITPELGRGVDDSLQYSTVPPTVFQTKRVDLAIAVAQWNVMMQTGTINTEPKKLLPGGRSYTAAEGLAIWGALREECGKTLVRKGPQPVSSAAGMKRVGDGGDENRGGGSGAMQKKARRALI